MTATPIPRTLALTVFADLELSLLTELPPGRRPVKTWVVPPEKRPAAYEWIKKQRGQVFVVCPYIEESEVETLKSVRAATQEFVNLQKIFPEHRLGLLRGRLKAEEKERVMNAFREGELDILVATPVVEVGVDIPTATVMVIEGANHFGLASLHQLRGRVGRGRQSSYCLLFSDSDEPSTLQRLKAMEKYHQGQKLAERDLAWRGPGDLYGTAQHGFPKLKLATFADEELIKTTREAAKNLVKIGLENYPLLMARLKELEKPVEPN
jgi:ATP-dependent DNA helicase RecG